MKKILLVVLSGMLVVALGATAYAQKLEFTASGRVEVSGVMQQNIQTAPFVDGSTNSLFGGIGLTENANLDKTATYWGERFTLFFNAAMGKELSGTVAFEMDSTRWGERTPAANNTNGAFMGRWNADAVAVEIKNAYIDFGLPYIGIPIPTTIRVGVQPIGTRPWIFNTADGAGITASMKVDPLQINLVWGKAVEGLDAAADDADVYGVNTSVALGAISVGGYAFWYNMNTYPFNDANTAAYGTTPRNSASMWWLGAYSDGKLGPLNYNFDFVLDTGTVESRRGFSDVDYQGWATRVHVAFPWEKFNFGVVGMYATGSDREKTSSSGLPGTATTVAGRNSTDVDGYVIPPGSESWAAFGESLVYYSMGRYDGSGIAPVGMYMPLGNYGNQMTRGAQGGSWMAKAYATFKATPWYSITFQGLYIGDTTDNGNTVGNALKTNGTPQDDSDIGWELNLMNDISIYKNLTWTIAGGYLFAGDALDQNVVSTPGAIRNVSPDNPWIIATKLTYAF